jgi:ATP-dependent RNA helicase HelY
MAAVRRNSRKTWDKRKSRNRLHPDKSARKSRQVANEPATRVVPQSREIKRLLEGIGTPRPAPFKPDPFQLDALALLEYEDVLVTAPTGSGKTWIAREEIRRLLENGRRAWYTSPLKALTNSKYQEFIDEFGADNVGILTGDRKENSDAPLIVGTTEIYRNQLFESLRGGSEVSADLVVLDEAHYLADEDRGHVWEEAIILTPPRIRLLLLSATIGNAHEFALWLEEVRGVRCGVITGPPKRPVPLRSAVLLPDRRLVPRMTVDERGPHDKKQRMPEMPPATLLTTLDGYNLLPAIVFLPTRRRCDQAASEAALTRRDPNDSRREARRDFMRSFVAQHAEVRGHRHWDTIIRGGVASHHAGHIPAWKLVIEKLMSAGLLDAIFATATVAAGVDFPARTVVLTGADARSASGWRQLTASEMQQMTGRAGRRGRDNVGFVIAAPGMHQDPERIAHLLKAPPDALVSQFRATYTTLLNLLDAYGSFASVREIAARSFAYRDSAHQIAQLEQSRDNSEQKIKHTLKDAACDLSISVVLGLERLLGIRARLQEAKPQTRAEVFHRWVNEVVKPGRVVGVGRSGKRLVMVTEKRDGSVRGFRDDGSSVSFPQERIGRVYSPVYRLREDDVERAFNEIRERGRELVLAEPRLRDADAEEVDALKIIDDSIENLLPSGADKQHCTQVVWELHTTAEDLERASRRIEALRDEVWSPFERRAKVLSVFGYLDYEAEKVTDRGRWLADLHIDRPLLVGEALENRLFNSLESKQLAGIMAALTADEDRDYGELELNDDMLDALSRFEEIGFKVSNEEWKYGLDPAPELNFSAAGAAVRWASGTEWSEIVRETRAEEGDLFRMFSRTGEALLQIAGLYRSHPEAANMAAAVAEMVLREPIR